MRPRVSKLAVFQTAERHSGSRPRYIRASIARFFNPFPGEIVVEIRRAIRIVFGMLESTGFVRNI